MATTTAVLYAGAVAAEEMLRYDLRFELSDDAKLLTIVETAMMCDEHDNVLPSRGGNARVQLEIPVSAFGPHAWFDMARAIADMQYASSCAADKSTNRKVSVFNKHVIWVRDVSFGARGAASFALEFSRGAESEQWKIRFHTNLWLSSKGKPYRISSGNSILFERFAAEKDAKPLISRRVAARSVARTLGAVFDDRLALPRGSRKKAFDLEFDQNFQWHVKGCDEAELVGLGGQWHVSKFRFGWHGRKKNKDQSENGVGIKSRIKSDTKADVILIGRSPDEQKPADGQVFRIGGPGGHCIELTPRTKQPEEPNKKDSEPERKKAKSTPKEPLCRFEIRTGTSPLDPLKPQVVATLCVADGELIVRQDRENICGPVPVSSVTLSETRIASTDAPLRTVLWGNAWSLSGIGETVRTEITSPVGRLEIGAPTTELLEQRKIEKERARAEGGDEYDEKSSERDEMERFFQASVGDQGGAREATVWIVADRPKRRSKFVPKGLRRVAVDVSLHESSAALPDASYSRLRFNGTDLRFSFEDGHALHELKGGEYPRLQPSSFVWVGSPADPQLNQAVFDLSRATLTCARDYDLMKLSFSFLDLNLLFNPRPVISPARTECRIVEHEDGRFVDSRPILVAHFDPQHVMEEAIFRPEPPLLPDVEWKPDKDTDLSKSFPTWPDVLRELTRLEAGDETTSLIGFRESVWTVKRNTDAEFADFQTRFQGKAREKDLPKDQQLYIGPFHLHPDAMALARMVRDDDVEDLTNKSIDAVFKKISSGLIESLKQQGKLYPVSAPEGAPPPVANAVKNELEFERHEALYALFRDFYRAQMLEAWLDALTNGSAHAENKFKFPIPEENEELELEHFIEGNRPASAKDWEKKLDARQTAIKLKFIAKVRNSGKPEDLASARLSGPSRLAFRINCRPVAGLNAEEAGTKKHSGDGPAAPGSASAGFEVIAFTFEALTDWSRHEAAVTRRAEKLYEALPSGLVPPLGNRAANLADHDILKFQGISEGRVSMAERLGQIQTSMDKDISQYETAIEIPSRLILSTAQDAVWRTDRRLPAEVLEAEPACSVEIEPATPKELVSGREVGVPETRRHDLWSARLVVRDVEPSLRVVGSPDFRSGALHGQKEGDKVRLPGRGAPPRGPLAPWFIGPEQMESTTLKAEHVKNSRGFVKASDEAAQKKEDNKFGLIRWLMERAIARKEVPIDFRFFRTTLDANDRHQLVMLSSAYGLPVLGKRDKDGVLQPNSGQIQPDEDFLVHDANSDQALYKPKPLRVNELSLTSLGGSFLHDTSFVPAAGAVDLWGRSLFDGFSIERWQQHIVLGRDIRGEVVYKGYLFPLGHRASLIKLTERIFLQTEKHGIKAMLRQRMFLNIGRPEKKYPAVGQPHRGRFWCAENATLLTQRTPDILDPNENTARGDNEEGLNGKISLGSAAPGLAFWPRTDVTERGLISFEFILDGNVTSLPLIFVDNIASTNPESVKALCEYYNESDRLPRRTIAMNGQRVRYAAENKPGDTHLATDKIVIAAHGRVKNVDSAWKGELTNFAPSGLLEGAEQPPFYPNMDYATVRLEQVERFSGGARITADVQYDGHYLKHGFAKDADSSAVRESNTINPLEVYLNLRRTAGLNMGTSGDRAAAIGRPNANIVAISRTKGVLGGDGDVFVEEKGGAGKKLSDPTLIDGKEKDQVVKPGGNGSNIVSLAAHFDQAVARGDSPPDSADRNEIEKAKNTLKILKGYFSGEAKLLGTIAIKDLLQLLNLPSPEEAMPELKETLEYGSALLRDVEEAAGDVANDVRTRVLIPLQTSVQRLDQEWQDLDKKLQERQRDLIAIGKVEDSVLQLRQIYPEISDGLREIDSALGDAIGTEDPVALSKKLGTVYETGRHFVGVLAGVASNPAERLRASVVDQINKILRQLTSLDKLSAALEEVKIVQHVKDKLKEWVDIFSNQFAEEVLEYLSLTITPPELGKVVGLVGTAPASCQTELDELERLANEAREDIRDVIREAVAGVFVSAAKRIINEENAVQVVKEELAGLGKSGWFGGLFYPSLQQKISERLKPIRQEIEKLPVTDDACRALRARLEAELDLFLRNSVARIEEWATKKSASAVDLVAIERSLLRALVTIEKVKAVETQAEKGDFRATGEAVADLIEEVFGVELLDVKYLEARTNRVFNLGDFKGQLDGLSGQVKDRVDAFYKDTLELDKTAVQRAHLVEAINACSLFRKSPAQHADKIPIANGDGAAILKIVNKDLFGHIKNAKDKMAELSTAADTAPNDFDKADLKRRVKEWETSIEKLESELRSLYCDLVDLVAGLCAAKQLIDGASWGQADRAFIENLATLSRRLEHAGSQVGGQLSVIVGLLVEFAKENPDVILLGGLGVYVNSELPDEVKDEFESVKQNVGKLDKSAAMALGQVVERAFQLIQKGALWAGDGTDKLAETVAKVQGGLADYGASLEPELTNLATASKEFSEQFKAFKPFSNSPSGATSLKELLEFRSPLEISIKRTFEGGESSYKKVALRLRELEARLAAEVRAVKQRLEGLPDEIRKELEKQVVESAPFKAIAGSKNGAGGYVPGVYRQLVDLRDQALDKAANAPLIGPKAAQTLLVEPVDRNRCLDDGVFKLSKSCDRFDEEADLLRKLVEEAPPLTSDHRGPFLRFLHSWRTSRAAPQVISRQVEEFTADVMRGDVLSMIDIAAFRDEIEDSLTGLIPTRATLGYGFTTQVKTKGDSSRPIFEPLIGSPFSLSVRSSVDLLRPEMVDFTASGVLGPFNVNLVGDLVDALTLKFGGAAFQMDGGSKPRFDVIYEDFEIGRDLEFAQQLQEFLTPKEGSGAYLQPLTRTVGIEAGYGINLGTLSLGVTSFFNVSLNVGAELPFSDEEALFKVSLGRRLSPFTMSVIPFAGAGYFAIFAGANGLRGFESAFEFGGGGSIGFGPLNAQARIMVGVFVRVLEDRYGVKTTELSGTFFAGGSASIWIFHFATSLYVRLGSSSDGAMYGEAVFSFSFSLGIADYDYSITAMKEEKKLGSGGGAQTGQLDHRLPQLFDREDEGGVRFAHMGIRDVMSDATPIELAAVRRKRRRKGKRVRRAPANTADVMAETVCQSEDWSTYIKYFDVNLLNACEAK